MARPEACKELDRKIDAKTATRADAARCNDAIEKKARLALEKRLTSIEQKQAINDLNDFMHLKYERWFKGVQLRQYQWDQEYFVSIAAAFEAARESFKKSLGMAVNDKPSSGIIAEILRVALVVAAPALFGSLAKAGVQKRLPKLGSRLHNKGQWRAVAQLASKEKVSFVSRGLMSSGQAMKKLFSGNAGPDVAKDLTKATVKSSAKGTSHERAKWKNASSEWADFRTINVWELKTQLREQINPNYEAFHDAVDDFYNLLMQGDLAKAILKSAGWNLESAKRTAIMKIHFHQQDFIFDNQFLKFEPKLSMSKEMMANAFERRMWAEWILAVAPSSFAPIRKQKYREGFQGPRPIPGKYYYEYRYFPETIRRRFAVLGIHMKNNYSSIARQTVTDNRPNGVPRALLDVGNQLDNSEIKQLMQWANNLNEAIVDKWKPADLIERPGELEKSFSAAAAGN